MDLKNTRALVTGGSEGIGRALGAALVKHGAKVGLMARRKEPLEKTAEEIGAAAFAGDVADPADVKHTVNAFVESFGGIDVLINNAGIGYFAHLPEIDPEQFERTLAVNVTGAMLMTREVVPHLIAQESGHIVNISSTAGTKGFAGGTSYVASKFALKGMTECWRDEFRRKNVRVMLVNPSEVQTGFGGRGEPEVLNPKKLVAADIADAVVGALQIDDRGFIPEFSVFATNPF